jgi:putative ABC transport system permease protein
MLGIFIGIAAVVGLISLGEGLQNAVTGQFSALGTDKLIITNAATSFGPPGSTAVMKLTDHDVEVIKSVSGVDFVIPRVLRPVKLEFNKVAGYTFAVSMPEDQKQLDLIYETINLDAQEGKLLSSTDKGKVLLGNDFIKTDVEGKMINVGSTIKIQDKNFQVIGFLKPASTAQINIAILMLDSDIKNILNIDNEWDMIIVTIKEGYDPESVAENIKEKLRKDRHEKIGEEDFSVQTPASLLQSVNTVLNIINLIIAGIAGISLFVGGIGIANTMYTSVLERRKEIGVMKAIGAKNKDILFIFLIESALLGLIGGIIGVLFGLGMAFGISSGANSALGSQLLAVKVSWPLLLSALAFSLIVGIISGVLPAIQGSKLKPVDALRS